MVHLKLLKLLKNKLHKLKNIVKIFVFKKFKNTIYSLKNIKNEQIVIHHHFGLGDIIICNGLVNYVSSKVEKVYLPVEEKYFVQTQFLYKDNNKITVIEVKNKKEIYKLFKHLKILRVGFEKNYGKFNKSFYDQLELPYKYSFNYFHIPKAYKKEEELLLHLKSFYKIKGKYNLIHNQSSYGKVDIKVNNDFGCVFVDKDSDIFQNLFLYTKVIEQATEIHCVDSSFLHLVERVNTDAKLYFHYKKTYNQSSEKLELKKNWNIII